jgi:hypothetical protein
VEGAPCAAEEDGDEDGDEEGDDGGGVLCDGLEVGGGDSATLAV